MLRWGKDRLVSADKVVCVKVRPVGASCVREWYGYADQFSLGMFCSGYVRLVVAC